MTPLNRLRKASLPARTILLVIGLPAAAWAAGCAGRTALMDVSGTVMYEKPRITQVTHTLRDSRAAGGAAVVQVTMSGDPGLSACFDIYPGIATAQPMAETQAGTYSGEFAFPLETVGGPFTIVVRLKHEQAGEVTWRAPDLITIPLADRPED